MPSSSASSSPARLLRSPGGPCAAGTDPRADTFGEEITAIPPRLIEGQIRTAEVQGSEKRAQSRGTRPPCTRWKVFPLRCTLDHLCRYGNTSHGRPGLALGMRVPPLGWEGAAGTPRLA